MHYVCLACGKLLQVLDLRMTRYRHMVQAAVHHHPITNKPLMSQTTTEHNMADNIKDCTFR